MAGVPRNKPKKKKKKHPFFFHSPHRTRERGGGGRNVSQKPDTNSIDRLKRKTRTRNSKRRIVWVQYSESRRTYGGAEPPRPPSNWPGRRTLLHFTSRRTHSSRLPGLRINADQRHSAHPAAADSDHVAASPQVSLHFFGDGLGHRQTAQAGAGLTERADEMLRREARRLKRLPGTHAELHVVEDDLDRCLILHVASRHRARHHRIVVTEKQSRAQRDSRPLARLNNVRSSRKRVQAAEPASVNNARPSSHARRAREAAGSRRDHVPKLIRHTHHGRSTMPRSGNSRRLGRFHIVGVARPQLERCLFRIDQT